MTTFYSCSRRFVALSIMVSGTLLLTACTVPSWVSSTFGPSERDSENKVRGAKHRPLMNPQSSSPQAPAKKEVSRPSAYLDKPRSAPSIDTNPYDYYDDVGNVRVPKPVEKKPSASAVAKMEAMVRKPFEGNPLTSSETVAVAPIPPAPVEQQASSGWFGRMADRISGESETPEAKEGQNAEYPTLSSVPKVPEAMDNVRAERDQYREELTQDHVQAVQKKQQLTEEPVAAQAPAVAASAPATVKTPKKEPAKQVVKKKPSAEAEPKEVAGKEPVLLGHMRKAAELAPSAGDELSLSEYEGSYARDLPSTEMPQLSARKKSAAQ